MAMTTLKIGFKALTLVWCVILLLLTLGFFMRYLSFWPYELSRYVDYAVALLCAVLVFFSFKGSRAAFVVSFLFVLVSSTMAVWGLFVIKDLGYWPSGCVAGVGIIYVLAKVVEYKYITKKAMILMGTSILIAAISIVCMSCHRTKFKEQTQSYLKENADILEHHGQGFKIDSELLDHVVDNYELFFTGETHGIALNFELRYDFLVYFYYKANVRYLLIETSPSQAAVMNHYLETGEELWLNRMYAAIKGTFAWTRDSFDYLKRVRRFNQGLPRTERIRCVGVDIEHQPQFALTYLNHLLPSDQIPVVIQADIEYVQNESASSSPNSINSWAIGAQIAESIAEHSDVYQHYLGDNLFLFQLIADNIVATKEAYGNRQQGRFNQIRDAAMYANFLKFYKQLPPAHYFGQFGDAHIFRKPYLRTQWFASYLEKPDSPVTGKVMSIVFDYVNCTRMTKHPTYSKAPYTSKYRPDLFATYQSGDSVLFKLVGGDSPFNTINILPGTNRHGTTAYFQFLLVISNSSPTEPFGGDCEFKDGSYDNKPLQ